MRRSSSPRSLALLLLLGMAVALPATVVDANNDYTVQVYGFIDPDYRASDVAPYGHRAIGSRMVVATVRLPGSVLIGRPWGSREMDLSKPFFGIFGGWRDTRRWYGWWHRSDWHHSSNSGYWWNGSISTYRFENRNKLYLYYLASEEIRHAGQGIQVRRQTLARLSGREYEISIDHETVLYRIYWTAMEGGAPNGVVNYVEARTQGMQVPWTLWDKTFGHVHDEWGAMSGQHIPAIPATTTSWDSGSEAKVLYSTDAGERQHVWPQTLQVPILSGDFSLPIASGSHFYHGSHALAGVHVSMMPWLSLPHDMDDWEDVLDSYGNQVRNDSQHAIDTTNVAGLASELNNEANFGRAYQSATRIDDEIVPQVDSAIEANNGGFIYRVHQTRVGGDEIIKSLEFISLRSMFEVIDWSRSQNQGVSRRHHDFVELNNRIIGGYVHGSEIRSYRVTVDPNQPTEDGSAPGLRTLHASVVLRDGELEVSFDRLWLPSFAAVVGKPEQLRGIPWQALPTEGLRQQGQALERILLDNQGTTPIHVVQDTEDDSGILRIPAGDAHEDDDDLVLDVGLLKRDANSLDNAVQHGHPTDPRQAEAMAGNDPHAASSEVVAMKAYLTDDEELQEMQTDGQGRARPYDSPNGKDWEGDPVGASDSITDGDRGLAGAWTRDFQKELIDSDTMGEGKVTWVEDDADREAEILDHSVREVQELAAPHLEMSKPLPEHDRYRMRPVMLAAGYTGAYFSGNGQPSAQGDNPHPPEPVGVGVHFGEPVYDVDGDGDADRFYSTDAWSQGFPYLQLEWFKEGHHKKCAKWWGWFSGIDKQRPHNAYALWGAHRIKNGSPMGRRLITYGHSRNYDFRRYTRGFLGWKKCVEWWGKSFGFIDGDSIRLRAKDPVALQAIAEPVTMHSQDLGDWHLVKADGADDDDPLEYVRPGSYDPAAYDLVYQAKRTVFIYEGLNLYEDGLPVDEHGDEVLLDEIPCTDAAGNVVMNFDPEPAIDIANGYMWVETLIDPVDQSVAVQHIFWPPYFDPTETVPEQDPDLYRSVSPSWQFGSTAFHDVTPFADRVSGKAVQFLANNNPNVTDISMNTGVYRFPRAHSLRNKTLSMLPSVKRAMETEFMGTIVNTASGLGGYVWDVQSDKPVMQWNVRGYQGADIRNLDDHKTGDGSVVMETTAGAGMYPYKGKWHGFSDRSTQRDILKNKWDWHFLQPASLKIPQYVDYTARNPVRLSAVPEMLADDDGRMYTDMELAIDTDAQRLELAAERRKRLMDNGYYLFSGAAGREFELEYALAMPSFIQLVCVEWDDRSDVMRRLAEAGRTASFIGKTAEEQVHYRNTGINSCIAEAQFKGYLNEMYFGRLRFNVKIDGAVATAIANSDMSVSHASRRSDYLSAVEDQDVNTVSVRDGDNKQRQRLRRGGAGVANISGGPRDDERLKYTDFPFLAEDWLFDQPACHIPYPIFTLQPGQIDIADETAANMRATGLVQYRHPMLIYYLDTIEVVDDGELQTRDVSAIYVRYGTDCDPRVDEEDLSLFNLANYRGFSTTVSGGVLEEVRWSRFLSWAIRLHLEEHFLAVFGAVDPFRGIQDDEAQLAHLDTLDLDVADPGVEPIPPTEPIWPSEERPERVDPPEGDRPELGAFITALSGLVDDRLDRTDLHLAGEPPVPVIVESPVEVFDQDIAIDDEQVIWNGHLLGGELGRRLQAWIAPDTRELSVTLTIARQEYEIDQQLNDHPGEPLDMAWLYPPENATVISIADLDALDLPDSHLPVQVSISLQGAVADGLVGLGTDMAPLRLAIDAAVDDTVLSMEPLPSQTPDDGLLRIGDAIHRYAVIAPDPDTGLDRLQVSTALVTPQASGTFCEILDPLPLDPDATPLADLVDAQWQQHLDAVAAWDAQQAQYEAYLAADAAWQAAHDGFLEAYADWTYAMELFAREHDQWQAQKDAYDVAETLREERESLNLRIADYEIHRDTLIDGVVDDVALLRSLPLANVVDNAEDAVIAADTMAYYRYFIDSGIPEAQISTEDLLAWH